LEGRHGSKGSVTEQCDAPQTSDYR
jgi:hypothetical protein